MWNKEWQNLTNLLWFNQVGFCDFKKKKIRQRSGLHLSAPLAGEWIMGRSKDGLKREMPFSLALTKKKKKKKKRKEALNWGNRGRLWNWLGKGWGKLWLKWSFNRMFQSGFNKEFFLATVQTFLVKFKGKKKSFGSFISEKICYI